MLEQVVGERAQIWGSESVEAVISTSLQLAWPIFQNEAVHAKRDLARKAALTNKS